MKAMLLTGPGAPLACTDLPDEAPAPGEATVALRCAALNHRDVWIQKGNYHVLKFPVVPGADGAGVVSAVGGGVDRAWIGREVIVNPGLDWGDSETRARSDFYPLGCPRNGTFAEAVNVPAIQLAARPAHLDWEHAAALPLSGVTAYRAVASRAGLQPGERVLVTGIGGGVALAVALDFRVMAGNAHMRVPEIALGMNMSWQSVPRMLHLMGPARTKQAVILADQRISAQEAYEWRLVEQVADPGKAFEAAMTLAEKVAVQPPLSVAMTKLTVNRLAHALDDLASHMDVDQFALASLSEDHKEGVAAFLERRKPKFRGR